MVPWIVKYGIDFVLVRNILLTELPPHPTNKCSNADFPFSHI